LLSARARIALCSCVAALASLAAPGAASAIIPSSQIGVPTGTTFPLIEPGKMITISGTAVGLSEVDINCYNHNEEGGFRTVIRKVPVTGGAFKAEVPLSNIYAALCQLRAVPAEDEKNYPPGTTSAFEGPLIVASNYTPEETWGYFASSSTLAGTFFFESAGSYAVESMLYSAAAHNDEFLFFGDADLRYDPPIKTRAAIQVDGANAYVAESTRELENHFETETKSPVALAGKPAITVTKSFDEATRQMSIHEEEPLVKCAPSNEYPAKAASCKSWASTGVTLVRTLQSSNEDHLGWLTDTWRSTDGAAHTVNARYYTEMYDHASGAMYEFPGEAAFAATKSKETKTIPAGPGMIQFKSVPALADAGNGEDPQGALTFDAAPTEPVVFTTGSVEKENISVFEMPYTKSVPAGGSSSTLRMAFVQSFSLTEARALAEGVLASYYPSVAIASPANGSATSSPTVTVNGTASDSLALSSLTVNGAAVAVGAGGAWSAAVALKPGANTITATATNQSGLARSAAETVTYTPSVAGKVGAPNGSSGRVTVKLACHGLAGSSCKVRLTLTTVEKLRHGRLTGLVAAHTKSKTVTVGSLVATIPAGSTRKVTIPLNGKGRKLLTRFHHLPAHLTATLEGPTGRASVFAQGITVRPSRPHRR
jgi:hypothetical protein